MRCDEFLHGETADLVHGLAHRCQLCVLCEFDVVERHHGDVFGNADTCRTGGLERSDGLHVAGDEHGGRRGPDRRSRVSSRRMDSRPASRLNPSFFPAEEMITRSSRNGIPASSSARRYPAMRSLAGWVSVLALIIAM